VEPVGAYGVIVLAVSISIPVVFLLLAGDRWKWKALYAVGLALLATLFWTWMLSGSC